MSKKVKHLVGSKSQFQTYLMNRDQNTVFENHDSIFNDYALAHMSLSTIYNVMCNLNRGII